ncbi:MAG TPA: PKD domain-containing protein, partial [Gemmataceae bacterium]|nr:PKD domain-containing protein [Gemmataceae bacterium]
MPKSLSHRRLRLDPMECRVNPSHTVTIVATDLTGPEGTEVALTSDVTGAVAPIYTWSVTRDGAEFATATTEDFTFTPDDDGTYVVTLSVADTGADPADPTGENHTVTDTETITATNVAPTATVSGPTTSVPGLPVTFTLGATDPSEVDEEAGFEFQIDWDGDGTTDETVTGPAGTTVTHTFAGTGTNTVTVTATDKDDGTSAPVTLAVAVKTAALIDDPLSPGDQLLAVGGTDGADSIQLIPG